MPSTGYGWIEANWIVKVITFITSHFQTQEITNIKCSSNALTKKRQTIIPIAFMKIFDLPCVSEGGSNDNNNKNQGGKDAKCSNEHSIEQNCCPLARTQARTCLTFVLTRIQANHNYVGSILDMEDLVCICNAIIWCILGF